MRVYAFRKVTRVAGIAAAGALTVAALALARGQAHDTTITIRGYTFVEQPNLMYGSLDSDTRKCLAGRTVKLYDSSSRPSEPYELADTDKTSASGAWSGVVDGDKFFFKAVVTKSKYGPKHHRKTCRADSTTVVIT